MFARVEVASRPEFAPRPGINDPQTEGLLRRLEQAHPQIRAKIRWSCWVDAYWLEVATSASELERATSEIFLDPVLQFLVKQGRELAPLLSGRGKVFGLERRYRPGVTDNIGKTAHEALEIVLGHALPEAQASSGGIWIVEGDLSRDELAKAARDILCNELIESWRLLEGAEALLAGDRFAAAQVEHDLPRVLVKGSGEITHVKLDGLSDAELEKLSRENTWALSLAEMRAIRENFTRLGRTPTDVEIEVIAQTWSEHCKHKIFAAKMNYESRDPGADPGKSEIPSVVDSLFKKTVAGTTSAIPRDWLLSVFSDNAGILAFDEEDAFCIKVETHNSPSALDPYGGSLTGIVGVNRDILGCGLGAKPIFNTDVFCVAVPDYQPSLPDRLLHPRRILEGVRRGVEHGGNKSGIPTVNGALVFDERYLGKPLIYVGTGGFMPRYSAGRPCELKEILPGDRICMVGGRIGKDGIHGATFSSLALDEGSPATAVQLGDPITQKRAADFLLEARDLGLYRAVTDNGAGGLSSSVGELAGLSNGARMDVSKARTKYPGLKPFELTVSESQERMTIAVQPEKLSAFLELAGRRGVEVSDLGEFTNSGRFEIFYGSERVADLELEFLHKGVPRLEIQARWDGRPEKYRAEAGEKAGATSAASNAGLSGPVGVISSAETPKFATEGARTLLGLLGRNNIASKEWLIRQYDHEVQGASVVKPLHQVAIGTSAQRSGPNDAGVVKPKASSSRGIAVGCGIAPRLSDVDAYRMAEAAVDEAVRNVLCVGAEFGNEESVLALVDNFCWPDPVGNLDKAAALVRACYGMRHAALKLQAPFVSGKDSMKNDFRGKREGRDVVISVPPTLLVTAVARVPDVAYARTSDFKAAGDVLYRLGPGRFGLGAGELEYWVRETAGSSSGAGARMEASPSAAVSKWLSGASKLAIGEPDWDSALATYQWIGGAKGRSQRQLRSLHDVSEGGLLVAVAECGLARGLGARLDFGAATGAALWEAAFGEGFHSFVASVSPAQASALEAEWKSLGVPFARLGTVSNDGWLSAKSSGEAFSVEMEKAHSAWKKEGYWQ